MNAEIIAIGTELLLGDIVNTDAQFISQGLAELGINVYYHTAVGDNHRRLEEVLRLARSRSDIIITTGGLGPTYDDMSKDVVAKVFGRKLCLHEPSLRRIEGFFTRVGRVMTENNKKQAMLPEDCTVFDNDWGTAPGCAVCDSGVHVLMLPGPPRECDPMFQYRARPYLEALSDGVIVSRNLRIYGIGESALEDKLSGFMEKMTNPTVAPYAKEGECMLRVTARAASHEEALGMLDPVVEELRLVIGSAVYGVDVSSLEERVVLLLKTTGKTVSAAESCTGGMLGARITSIPGSSEVFMGGICAYQNEIKAKLLGISKRTLAERGAVSRETAAQMALGVRDVLRSDFGIGITGIAGPGGATADKPVGLVYIALSDGGMTWVREMRQNGDRERVRRSASSMALDMLRRMLEKL